jgi:adenylate cyclase
VSIRIRIDGNAAATVTIKSAEPGVERSEYEYAIPVADATELLQRREGAVIVKVRHLVTVGEHLWEIDEFDGENEGLILAEIELGCASEHFERPTWLGTEVTHDRRFYNAELAKVPVSRWSDRQQPELASSELASELTDGI